MVIPQIVDGDIGIIIQYLHRSLVLIFDPRGGEGVGVSVGGGGGVISMRFMLFPTEKKRSKKLRGWIKGYFKEKGHPYEKPI